MGQNKFNMGFTMRFIFRSALKSAAALGLLLASFQSNATGFEFRVADKAAELFYLYKSSTFGYGGSDVGWGVMFNENDDVMLSGSLLVSGNGAGGKRALQFGVGVKGYVADLNGADLQGGGLGIGGLVRYVFSSSTPFAILVEAYTVPTITTLGDAADFSEARIAFELEVSPSARAYIGYRTVTLEDDGNNEYELDDSAHFGVRLSF